MGHYPCEPFDTMFLPTLDLLSRGSDQLAVA